MTTICNFIENVLDFVSALLSVKPSANDKALVRMYYCMITPSVVQGKHAKIYMA